MTPITLLPAHPSTMLSCLEILFTDIFIQGTAGHISSLKPSLSEYDDVESDARHSNSFTFNKG